MTYPLHKADDRPELKIGEGGGETKAKMELILVPVDFRFGDEEHLEFLIFDMYNILSSPNSFS